MQKVEHRERLRERELKHSLPPTREALKVASDSRVSAQKFLEETGGRRGPEFMATVQRAANHAPRQVEPNVDVHEAKQLAAHGNIHTEELSTSTTAIFLKLTGASIGGLLKGAADSMGLTNIAGGVVKLYQAQSKFYLAALGAVGVIDLEKRGTSVSQLLKEGLGCYGQGLKEIGVGTLKFAGEFTGLTSAYMCVQCLVTGNYAMAAVYAGCAVMSFMMIKGIGKQLVENAAKQALSGAAHELGEKVTAQVMQKLGPEALEKMGAEAAREMSKELAQLIAKEGTEALTKETVQELGKKLGIQVTETALEKIGYQAIIKDATLQFLKENMATGVLSKKLTELGYNRISATLLAKKVAQGEADVVVKKLLEDGITQQVTAYIQQGMRKPFEQQFKKVLLNELGQESADQTLAQSAKIINEALTSQAKLLAKTSGKTTEQALQELTAQYVQAGWAGVREGTEIAVRRLTRAGIEDAFNEFRKKKRSSESAPVEPVAGHQSRKSSLAAINAEEMQQAETSAHNAKEEFAPKSDISQTLIMDADGTVRAVTLVRRGTECYQTGSHIVSEGRRAK